MLLSRFEFFVALRYLKAKRKQAMISLITGISVLGVAAGVMAMVVALAINTGFRNTLQRKMVAYDVGGTRPRPRRKPMARAGHPRKKRTVNA